MDRSNHNFRVQRWVLGIALILFGIKLYAWYLTSSVSILTDAMESIVNVLAGFVSLYSLYLSSQPSDINHPYGHGKAEFLSAAVEGSLIVVAAIVIFYEAISRYVDPQPVGQIDTGIILLLVSAFVNGAVGYYCVKTGNKNQSPALVASGRHLQTDALSTVGIGVGLIGLLLTGWAWLDSAIAILFALFILVTGYRIVRRSLEGIMDKADLELLQTLVDRLNHERRDNWVDLHNLRIIKFGSVLHLDCHLTLPWYLNMREAHEEIDTLLELVRKDFGASVEMFVHTDGCQPFSCSICQKASCDVRQYPAKRKIVWSIDNLSANQKHGHTLSGKMLNEAS